MLKYMPLAITHSYIFSYSFTFYISKLHINITISLLLWSYCIIFIISIIWYNVTLLYLSIK